MAYYNRDLKKFDQTNFEYLNEGSCAQIIYNHNIIFKQYFSSANLLERLSEYMFDILKDINNPHFIELIDIYTKKNFLKSFFLRSNKQYFIVDAYSAKYYENKNINILNEPIDYLLDNIRELEILFDIFSNNAILTDDLHGKNVIYTSQKIIIIDPDFFTVHKRKDIIIKNKLRLLRLCTEICEDMLSLESKYPNEEIDKMLKKLTDFKLNEATDISYEISKKLRHVKKPIDYFLN